LSGVPMMASLNPAWDLHSRLAVLCAAVMAVH
jgi:hypothetical protein